MMIFFGLLIFLVLISALGYGLLLFWPEADRRPIFALALAVGGGLIAWQLFIAVFIVKLSLGTWVEWLIVAEILGLYGWHRFKGKKIMPSFKVRGQRSVIELSLFCLIALTVGLSLVRVATEPLVTFDALAVWAYRVKILYYHLPNLFNAGAVGNNATIGWLSMSKANYPWLLSLLGWFQARLTGGVSDTWINFLPWCYYVGLLSAVYALAKDKLDRLWSLALTLAVATMPLIFYHGYNFYADLPLAFYLAVICLVWRKWLADKAVSSLLLISVLAGLAVMIKLEAIFFVGSLLLLTALKIIIDKNKLKNIWPAIVVVCLTLPWFAWLVVNHLGLSNVAPGLGWHPQVTKSILFGVLTADSWHIWWYAVIMMLILAWTKVRSIKVFRYNLAWFVLNLSAFLMLYYFTETYVYAVDNSALSRNFILLIPLTVGIMVDCVSEYWMTDIG